MPEMCVAFGTHRFGPNHEVTSVDLSVDVFVVYRLEETGPAGPRVVLRIRREQWFAATSTHIDAFRLRIRVFAGKRCFGRRFPCDLIFVVRQFLAPLLLSFLNFRLLGILH